MQAAQEPQAADCSAPDLARAQSLPSDAAVRQVGLQHWASRLAHCSVFTIQKHASVLVHEQFQCCGPRVRAFTSQILRAQLEVHAEAEVRVLDRRARRSHSARLPLHPRTDTPVWPRVLCLKPYLLYIFRKYAVVQYICSFLYSC